MWPSLGNAENLKKSRQSKRARAIARALDQHVSHTDMERILRHYAELPGATWRDTVRHYISRLGGIECISKPIRKTRVRSTLTESPRRSTRMRPPGTAASFEKISGMRLRPPWFRLFSSSHRLLGKGEYGRVYEVKDQWGRTWAVKQGPLTEVDDVEKEAYYYQLFAAAGIGPKLYETDQNFYVDEKHTYIVMERACETLERFIRRTCPLTQSVQRDIEDKVRALFEKALAMGVICVDQKPSNILRRADGTLMLTDFGGDFCYEIAQDGPGSGHDASKLLLLFLVFSITVHDLCNVALFQRELCILSEVSNVAPR